MDKNNKKASEEFNSNFILNAVERHFTNPKNKSATSKFIKRQKKFKNRLKKEGY